MGRLVKVLAAATFGILVGSSAQATTLTFDIDAGFGGSIAVISGPYIEDGFMLTTCCTTGISLFSSWGPKGLPWGNAYSADPSTASATLFAGSLGDAVMLSVNGGHAFDLTSIDFADVFRAGGGQTISFHSIFKDGSVLDEVRSTTDSTVLETLTFNYANLASITWRTTDPSINRLSQFDNIVVSSVASTPIPAALPLFLSAIVGLGFAGWRRRRAV